MKNVKILLFLVLLFNSCKKDNVSINNQNPIDTTGFKALFRIEYNIDSNDVVKCYNLSSNYKKIKWVFSDEFTTTEANPEHKYNYILNGEPWVSLFVEDETGRTDSLRITYSIYYNQHGYDNANVLLLDINPAKFAIYKSPDYYSAKVDFFTFFNGYKQDTITYSTGKIITLNINNSNIFRLYSKVNDFVSIYVNIPTPNIDTVISRTSNISNPIDVYNRYSIKINPYNPDLIISYNDTLISRFLTKGTYLKIEDTELKHIFQGYICFKIASLQKSNPDIINFLLPNNSIGGSNYYYYNGITFNYKTGLIRGRIYNNTRSVYIDELVYECK